MRENVVIIMADQLRYDVLGRGFTPNIDSIREGGVDFTRAYCTCPLCVPARGAFFTGKWPNVNGSLINPWLASDSYYGSVHEGIDNLYRMMEKDWCSIHSGKQHLFTEGGKLEDVDKDTIWASTEKSYKEYLAENGVRAPGGPRFKTPVPEMKGGAYTRVTRYSNANTGCYPEDEKFYFDRYFAQKAVEAIRKRDRSRPLLLNAMFLAPHPPLEIPQPWYGKVAVDDFVMPENVGVFYPHQSPLQMYNLTGVVGARYRREEWMESWRVYLGLVSMLDDCVGMVLDTLREEGLYDDSIIIFTSDHGEMLGSHALFQKMCMYEEAAHVPLFISLPGRQARRIDDVVSHVDVLPTLCELLNLSHKGTFDGRSLLGIMEGRRDGTGVPAYIQFDGNGARSNFQRCVVMDRYKLIVDYFKDETFFELYDVVADPQETENLLFSGGHDVIALELVRLLRRHMEETSDMVAPPALAPEEFRKAYGDIPTRR